MPSYGTDPVTQSCIEKLKTQFGSQAEIFFVFNGTGANVIALKCLMESHQALVCSDTSHIHLDECAAPEKHIGCKVLALPSQNGKITCDQVREQIQRRGDQHFAQVKGFSLTLPTEYGTLYSESELMDFANLAKSESLFFHIDGARFPLAAHGLKKTFKELTQDLGVDALSLGGTKNGLLFGEAVLLFSEEAKSKAKYVRKQLLHLPSKMRFLAGQFEELYSTGLWKEIAGHTHKLALHLEHGLREIASVNVTQKVEANSVFAIFPREWIKTLKKEAFFYIWDESNFEARLMTSFDLTQSDIDKFLNKVRELESKHEL